LTDGNGTIASGARYNYDAYGVSLGSQPSTTNPSLTSLLYAGEQFDTGLQQYYLRARYYNQSTGRFGQLDPFGGSKFDPQSLHKYFYAHLDPVNGIDPSGLFTLNEQLIVRAITLILVGFLLGVVTNAAKNYAEGRALTAGAFQAGLTGALLAPVVALLPLLGVGLAAYGAYSSVSVVKTVFSTPNSTTGQKATAIALLGASLFGAYAGAKSVRLGGFWRAPTNSGTTSAAAAALEEIHIKPPGQPQPTIRSVARVTQDETVNPVPPNPNNGNSTIGGSQQQAAQRFRKRFRPRFIPPLFSGRLSRFAFVGTR
jgi:RHS repeat-associated protein